MVFLLSTIIITTTRTSPSYPWGGESKWVKGFHVCSPHRGLQLGMGGTWIQNGENLWDSKVRQMKQSPGKTRFKVGGPEQVPSGTLSMRHVASVNTLPPAGQNDAIRQGPGPGETCWSAGTWGGGVRPPPPRFSDPLALLTVIVVVVVVVMVMVVAAVVLIVVVVVNGSIVMAPDAAGDSRGKKKSGG